MDSQDPASLQTEYDNMLDYLLAEYKMAISRTLTETKGRQNAAQSAFDSKYVLQQDQQLGVGTYANTYRTYLKNDRSQQFATKVQEFRKDADRRAFRIECLMATRASAKGYGVKVYDYYISEKKGLLVMALGTVSNNQITRNDMENMLSVIQKMHIDGVWHQDLFQRNMLRVDQTDQWSIIDFGMAIPFELPVPELLRAVDYIGLFYGHAYIKDMSQGLLNGKEEGGVANQEIQDAKQYALETVCRLFNTEILDAAVKARVYEQGSFEKPHPDPTTVSRTYVSACSDMYNTLFATYKTQQKALRYVKLIHLSTLKERYLPWKTYGNAACNQNTETYVADFHTYFVERARDLH